MHRIAPAKPSARRLGSVRSVAMAASLATIFGVFTGPAKAQFVINASFGNSITGDANSANIISTINTAIATYQAKISTPVTVNIAFGEMTSGLGQSNTWFGNTSYSSFLSALNAHSFSADDAAALAVLNAAGSAVNPVNGATTINAKTANLRALGFNANPPGTQTFDGLTNGNWDGMISLNTLLTTPGSAGSSLQYSLLAVAEHEIDEVLGLGSALPDSPNGTIFPEDLYRYDSNGLRSYTTSGDNAWFSIDGTTNLVQYNMNSSGDYGDYHSSATAHVQDAFATPGASPVLGVELRALDVIGYNRVTSTTAVTPEPGTIALFTGMSAAGAVLALRRRRRK